jgi:hypothetical protein
MSSNARSEKPAPGIYFVGSFKIANEEKIMATDPCYSDGDKEIGNIKPGTWNAYTELVYAGNWGLRNASLTVVHESLQNCPPKGDISEELGVCGVDAGMLGFYAMNGFSPGDDDDDYGDFDAISHSVRGDLRAAANDYGVTSCSGYGDGGYRIFAKADSKGKIVALEAVFIQDDKDSRFLDEEEE